MDAAHILSTPSQSITSNFGPRRVPQNVYTPETTVGLQTAADAMQSSSSDALQTKPVKKRSQRRAKKPPVNIKTDTSDYPTVDSKTLNELCGSEVIVDVGHKKFSDLPADKATVSPAKSTADKDEAKIRRTMRRRAAKEAKDKLKEHEKRRKLLCLPSKVAALMDEASRESLAASQMSMTQVSPTKNTMKLDTVKLVNRPHPVRDAESASLIPTVEKSPNITITSSLLPDTSSQPQNPVIRSDVRPDLTYALNTETKSNDSQDSSKHIRVLEFSPSPKRKRARREAVGDGCSSAGDGVALQKEANTNSQLKSTENDQPVIPTAIDSMQAITAAAGTTSPPEIVTPTTPISRRSRRAAAKKMEATPKNVRKKKESPKGKLVLKGITKDPNLDKERDILTWGSEVSLAEDLCNVKAKEQDYEVCMQSGLDGVVLTSPSPGKQAASSPEFTTPVLRRSKRLTKEESVANKGETISVQTPPVQKVADNVRTTSHESGREFTLLVEMPPQLTPKGKVISGPADNVVPVSSPGPAGKYVSMPSDFDAMFAKAKASPQLGSPLTNIPSPMYQMATTSPARDSSPAKPEARTPRKSHRKKKPVTPKRTTPVKILPKEPIPVNVALAVSNTIPAVLSSPKQQRSLPNILRRTPSKSPGKSWKQKVQVVSNKDQQATTTDSKTNKSKLSLNKVKSNKPLPQSVTGSKSAGGGADTQNMEDIQTNSDCVDVQVRAGKLNVSDPESEAAKSLLNLTYALGLSPTKCRPEINRAGGAVALSTVNEVEPDLETGNSELSESIKPPISTSTPDQSKHKSKASKRHSPGHLLKAGGDSGVLHFQPSEGGDNIADKLLQHYHKRTPVKADIKSTGEGSSTQSVSPDSTMNTSDYETAAAVNSILATPEKVSLSPYKRLTPDPKATVVFKTPCKVPPIAAASPARGCRTPVKHISWDLARLSEVTTPPRQHVAMARNVMASPVRSSALNQLIHHSASELASSSPAKTITGTMKTATKATNIKSSATSIEINATPLDSSLSVPENSVDDEAKTTSSETTVERHKDDIVDKTQSKKAEERNVGSRKDDTENTTQNKGTSVIDKPTVVGTEVIPSTGAVPQTPTAVLSPKKKKKSSKKKKRRHSKGDSKDGSAKKHGHKKSRKRHRSEETEEKDSTEKPKKKVRENYMILLFVKYECSRHGNIV